MINNFVVMCRIIKAPVFKDNNVWLTIASAHETPDYIDQKTGQNKYNEEIITVLIAPHRVEYLMKNSYVGQLVHLTGTINGNGGAPILLVDQIYQLTDRTGAYKK